MHTHSTHTAPTSKRTQSIYMMREDYRSRYRRTAAAAAHHHNGIVVQQQAALWHFYRYRYTPCVRDTQTPGELTHTNYFPETHHKKCRNAVSNILPAPNKSFLRKFALLHELTGSLWDRRTGVWVHCVAFAR